MSINHASRVLAGILPGRKDNLMYALLHLEEDHFRDESHRVIYAALGKYMDLTSDVIPQHLFADLLSNSKTLDGAKALLFEETFSEAETLEIPDHEFRYSVEALKDHRAEQLTGEAIATAFEILQRGADVGKDRFEGHKEAREYASSQFSVIDKLDNIEVAPEGDMRHEAKDVISEYMDRKEGKTGNGILTGIKSVDRVGGGFAKGELAVFAAFTNAGKASPLWTPVLTPKGWRRIGELKAGDVISSTSGGHQTVSEVFDRGVMDTYRVTTADGGSVLTAADHLWQFQLFQDRYASTKDFRVESTEEIAEHLRHPRRVFLPLPAPIEFDHQDLAVDAYTMGALLGDGSFRMQEVRFSSHEDDSEILENLVVPGEWVKTTGSDWRLRGGTSLREEIQELGLWGTYSHEKWIPEPYLWGSVEDRHALLQGLMDTDGTIDASGKGAEICLSSERMIHDVVALVRSLGGNTTKVKKKETTHRDAWRVSVMHLPNSMNPFRLKRKADRWEKRQRSYDFRRVVSVEREGAEPVRCIAVSDPNHLYVTEDFLVTHNTQFCCQTAWDAAVMQGANVYFATSETVRTTVRRRIVARHSRLPKFGLERGLDSTDLKNGTLSPEEEKALLAVVKDLDTNSNYGKIFISQIPRGATLSYFETRMNRQQQQWNIDLALMDYLALLKSDRKRTSEREEMSEVIKDAKVFATSFNNGKGVPLITPWQIRRESYQDAQRTGAYGLSSLSDTAEIEKSADQIISLLRVPESPGTLSLQFLKMRDGEIPNAITLTHDFRNALLTDEKQKSSGFGSAFAPASGIGAFGI